MYEITFDLQRFSVINNKKDSTLVSGSDSDDKITNTAANVTIAAGGGNDSVVNKEYADNMSVSGGAGNDSIYNNGKYSSNTTITGDAGNDFILNNSYDVTIDGGAGKDSISNFGSNVIIDGGDDNDEIYNSGSGVKIDGGDGNDSINTGGYNPTINGGAGNDSINSEGFNATITGGAGNDSISNYGMNSSLFGGEDNDTIYNYAGGVTIGGGDGNDYINSVTKSNYTIDSSWGLVTINAGAGDDTIYSKDPNVSINGGDGNDIISLGSSWQNITIKGGEGNDTVYTSSKRTKGILFQYAEGDGNDYIQNWKSGDTLSVSSGTYSTTKSGSDIIVTVGNGKITLAGAASLSKVNISGKKKTEPVTTNNWKLSGTTAKYGTASKTLAQISDVKSVSGLSVSGNIITVPKNIIGNSKKVTVNGSGYEFDFNAGNILITGSKNVDSIANSGAKVTIGGGAGNDVISLGSSAANNIIVYNNGDGKDIIYGVDSNDTIKIKSGTAKTSTSGNDVILTVGKGSITVKDAKNKTFSYSDAGGKHTYKAVVEKPYKVNSAGTAVAIYNTYSKEDFEVESEIADGSKIVTINAAALTSGLNISGNDKANVILGGKGNDSIDGLSGNDTLTSGDGADIFLYYNGDGNDFITDYETKDIIQISSDDEIVTPSTKGRDIVLKVGDGSITLKNAAKNKIGVTYVENEVEHDYIKGEQTVVMEGKAATVSENYWKTTFDIANFGKGIQTVDASAVTHALKITGNNKANQILGGSGQNTLTGGKGNDTLQGGDKADVFIYNAGNAGDGNDVIYEYGKGDVISIVSGSVDSHTVKGDTVIFSIGNGKISVAGAAGKKITYYDENHSNGYSHIYPRGNSNVAEPLWFAEDDSDYELTPNLSSIVQNNSADCSFVNTSAKLSKETNLITYSGSKK